MANVRFDLNRKGVRELLRGPEVQAELRQRAQRIAAAAGPGHEVQMWVGRNRARATVRTATWQARHAEATTRALTRAIDAGR